MIRVLKLLIGKKIGAFFNTHKEKSMWGYMETAFRQRYKKALARSFWDQLVFNSIFFLIMGFLIRFDIVTLDRTNILKYSPMVISIVLNLTFGTQYLQMCFRHLDLPILYYQFFLGANLVKSIKNRYFYLIKRGFWAISMLGLGLLVLLWIGGLQIAIVDFIRLCLIYFLIYVIYETYHLAIYYLIQPYTIELTVKSPPLQLFRRHSKPLCHRSLICPQQCAGLGYSPCNIFSCYVGNIARYF